jgi:hypothetical protein
MGRTANQSPATQRGPPGFNPSLVEVGFMVNEVTQVEVLLRALLYSTVSIILSTLHSNLFLDVMKTVQLRNSINNGHNTISVVKGESEHN